MRFLRARALGGIFGHLNTSLFCVPDDFRGDQKYRLFLNTVQKYKSIFGHPFTPSLTGKTSLWPKSIFGHPFTPSLTGKLPTCSKIRGEARARAREGRGSDLKSEPLFARMSLLILVLELAPVSAGALFLLNKFMEGARMTLSSPGGTINTPGQRQHRVSGSQVNFTSYPFTIQSGDALAEVTA